MKQGLTALLAAFTVMVAYQAEAVGKTTLTAYGTYWDQKDAAYGGSLKLSKSLVDMVYVDGRAGYLKTENGKQETIPLEASINLGLPGMITPYVGVGAGYYFIDSNLMDDASGYFGQIGAELIFTKIGVMAELRYLDLEGSYFDGVALNIGALWKF